MHQDEKTKLRRPRWMLADKTNLQAVDKQSKDKEIEEKKNVQVFAQNDESVKKEAEDQKEEMVDEAIEDETKEVEETELEAKQEKVDKWDPLDGLSEYEKIRLENIRQREALFAELQLEEAKVAATPPRAALVSTRTQRSAPSRRGLQMPKREKEEILPRRQSSRLRRASSMKYRGITLEW